MKTYLSDIRTAALQLLIGLVLLWFLITQIITPVYSPDVQSTPATDSYAHQAIQPFKLARNLSKTPEQFAEITRRPLFYSTRRPVETAKGVNSIAQYPRPDKKWTLTGTIVTGEYAVAIFSAKGDQNQTLSDGMKLEGWTVDEIEVGRVSLSRQEQEISMELLDDPALTTPAGRNGKSIFVNKEQYHNRIVRPM